MTVMYDLRYAVRTLWKHRGFTLVAVLCLALGIGVNTVIFSCVNAILLRPFPYAEPGQLVALRETNARQSLDDNEVSYPNFHDWRALSRAFASAGAYSGRAFILSGGDEPERVAGATISATMFPTLGLAPVVGRGFREDEDRPGAPRVALIGYGLWERRFQSDPRVVGRTIEIDGSPTEVIGVMPAGVRFPGVADVWIPLALDPTRGRGAHFLEVIARLSPGLTIERAQTEMQTIARRLSEQYPETNAEWGVSVASLRDHEVGETAPVLYVMQGAVLFVLLIACANVANLLLARATARGREIAIRSTLGAGRGRIVTQLLTESLILAVLGGALGALLAVWGLDLVIAMIPPILPYWMRFTIDAQVLLFTLGLAVTTGIVFGVAPALQASRSDVQDALRDGSRGAGASRQSKRLRGALVVAEVALSLVLLIGAGLLIKSFLRLQGVDPGFDYRRTLTMQVSLGGPQYDSLSARTAALERVLAAVAAVPGVTGAAAVNYAPLSGSNTGTAFFVEGEAVTPGGEHGAEFRVVTPDYFHVMRIPIVRGRSFTSQEVADSSAVVMVNQTLAARFFPGQEPVGKRLRRGLSADAPLLTIVGVVSDVKQRELGAAPNAQMYFTYPLAGGRSMTLVAATDGDPASAASAVRAAVRRAEPSVPVYELAAMRELYERSVWQPRLYGALFASFAVIALVLAALGVYSVIAYAVTQRTHEIGVRMALGAKRSDVFRLIVRGGVSLAGVGVVLGVAGALGLTRVLSNLLYGVSATDATMFIAVPALLIATAAVASFLPARRAIEVDPMVALRNE